MEERKEMKSTMRQQLQHTACAFFGILTVVLAFLLLVDPTAADALDVHCSYASSKDSCYKEVAIQRLDVDICDRITSDSVKNSCFSKLAIALNNMDMCRGIKKIHESSEDRAECYMEFVDGIEDYPICDQYIPVDKYYDQCIDKIYDETKTLEVCLYYVSPKKAISCIKKVAKKQNNESICNHLEQFREENTGCTRIATASRACDDEMGIDQHIQECLAPFYEEINKIDNKCDDYGKSLELKFRQKEHGKYFLPGEMGLRNQIDITLFWVDQAEKSADILVHQDLEEMTFRDIPLGYIVMVNNVNVQLLELTEEEYEGEKHNFARICVFKKEPEDGSSNEQEMVVEDIENNVEDENDNERETEDRDKRSDEEQEEEQTAAKTDDSIDENKSEEQEQQRKQNVIVRFLKWITSFVYGK